MNYSFTTKADLSVVDTYEIVACTFLSNDEVPQNDCFTIYVEHLPSPYCEPIYIEGCENEGYTIENFNLNTISQEETWCNGYVTVILPVYQLTLNKVCLTQWK